MSQDADDDAIAVLVGLGILAFVGIGVLAVLKEIGSHEPGEVISAKEASGLKSYTHAYTSSRSLYYSSDDCPHGDSAEQCPYKYHKV